MRAQVPCQARGGLAATACHASQRGQQWRAVPQSLLRTSLIRTKVRSAGLRLRCHCLSDLGEDIASERAKRRPLIISIVTVGFHFSC